MKLLSCMIFASLALSANLVHADASCKDAAGGKVSVNAGQQLKAAFGEGTSNGTSTQAPTTAR